MTGDGDPDRWRMTTDPFTPPQSLDEALAVIHLDAYVIRSLPMRWLMFRKAVRWSFESHQHYEVPELAFRLLPFGASMIKALASGDRGCERR